MALLSILVFTLISLGCTRGKTFTGIVSSTQAWKDTGSFITKFCFHDRKAVFQYETNTTSNGRWYFYLDDHWHEAVAEIDCNNKLAKSRFSVGISDLSGKQYVNQWLRPHFWYVVYADADTCSETAPPNDVFIGYTLTFLNPDSEGVANDHFGEDEKGLLSMYALLVMLYIGGISLFAKSVWQSIQKGGPMHEALQVLSVAIAIHFLAVFFMVMHLWIYKNDGQGSPFCETVSEICDVMSQVSMIHILLSLSVGWTLGSQTSNNTQQVMINISIAVVEVLLVIWEQSYDESHYTYHVHENFPGLLLVLLRILIAVMFGYNLHNTIKNERSSLRKDFYRSFSYGCYLWFLSFPFLMLVAMIFPQYWRHRVVTIGTVAIQLLALLILSRQFLSRSLYWEVSTLSSTTLPFKRDRGGARAD